MNSPLGRAFLGIGTLTLAFACAEGLPVTGLDEIAAASTQAASTTMDGTEVTSAGGSTGAAVIVSATGSTVPGVPAATAVGTEATETEDQGVATQGVAPAVIVRQDPTSAAGGPNLTIEDNTAGAASTSSGTTGTGSSGTTTGATTTGGTATGSTTTGSATGSTGGSGETGFEYVQATYTYGDGVSMGTVDVSQGQACLSGTAADAGSDFSNWGVGIGLQLAQDEGAIPFDARAEGLTGFSFTITGTIGAGLRVGVNTTSNENAAISQQLDGGDYTTVGSKMVQFSSLYQPNWDAGTAGAALDVTDIDALQFQITSRQGSSTTFDFCIEDLTFF